MAGRTDLGDILAALEVSRREGTYAFTAVAPGDPLPDVEIAAMISEVEGTTLILRRDVADAEGLAWEFEAAWLTVDVHTSLDAVGVTASVSTALAMRGIPCNVLAGLHHDHILVPLDQVGDALDAIERLRITREDVDR